MPNPQNESIVRRAIDLLSKPELPPDYEQIFDSNWVNHAPMPFPRGPEGFRAVHQFWHQGFPDLKMTIEQIFSDGDYVAAHFAIRGTHTGEFLGVPPTGKSVDATGTGIYRCQNGKMMEAWITPNLLAVFQQLGVVQTPTPQRHAA